jgi:hypothetical protein
MSQLTKEQISAWADHIKAQRGSGLTQQAYCKQHALKPPILVLEAKTGRPRKTEACAVDLH